VSGRATNMNTSTSATPGSQYWAMRPKFTCEPSSTKIISRMIRALALTKDSRCCASLWSMLKPNEDLLPISMPNTNTAMKPEAW
jgi:hypothetical protein